MAGTIWSFSGGGAALAEGLGPGWGRSDGIPALPAGLSPSTNLYSDITEEDLEEAGVQDPAHKRLLLDTLQLSK